MFINFRPHFLFHKRNENTYTILFVHKSYIPEWFYFIWIKIIQFECIGLRVNHEWARLHCHNCWGRLFSRWWWWWWWRCFYCCCFGRLDFVNITVILTARRMTSGRSCIGMRYFVFFNKAEHKRVICGLRTIKRK